MINIIKGRYYDNMYQRIRIGLQATITISCSKYLLSSYLHANAILKVF